MNRSFIETRLDAFAKSGLRLQNAIAEAENLRAECPNAKRVHFDYVLTNAKTSFVNLSKATEITTQSINVAQEIFGVGLFGMLDSLGLDGNFARVGCGSLIDIAARAVEVNTRQLMKICSEIQTQKEVENV